MTMNKSVTQKRHIWRKVFFAFIIAYGATWILGIHTVRTFHQEELHHFYEEQKLYYDNNKTEMGENVFWKGMLETYGGFPTWKEYKDWHGRESIDRYYAIFPFIILAWREGRHTGINEYHVWYIVGSTKLGQQLRWVE